MIPRLYNAQETEFTTLGLGVLSDCQRCTVTESRNGEYTLEMDYPITGAHYQEIKNDTLILAKPNDKHRNQPFRVTRISKPIGGIVTIQAEHITYKTSDIIVEPFSAGSAAEAVSGMNGNSVGYNPFTFTTDKSTVAQFTVSLPQSYRELMGGTRGSLLDVYGGEYEYDRFDIILRNTRGNDSGVVIEYGKNLTDLKQDESIANLITAVYPFWSNGESNLVTLPEKTVSVDNPMSVFPRIQALDLSGEFEEPPTEDELRAAAQSYINSTDLKKPSVSITASFEYLWQMEEYKDDPVYKTIAALERVNLCDIVTVRFTALGVDATAKIVSAAYNVLLEKYDSVQIGESKTNLTSSLAEQQAAIDEAPTVDVMAQAILNATNAITGATGGYVVFDPPRNPQRILIMDTPDKATAVNVWQWNLNGLGFSNTGINGPYRLAMTTSPGAIVADFITAGTLNANIIKAGVIQDVAGKNSINMETGAVSMQGAFTATSGNFKTVLDAGTLKYSVNNVLKAQFSQVGTDQGLMIYDSSGNILSHVGTQVVAGQSVGVITTPSTPGGLAYIPVIQMNSNTSKANVTNCELYSRTANWQTLTINGVQYTVLVAS